MSALVEIAHVDLVLDGRPVLREVSLAVEAGERVAIVGANGAGKSTLLRRMMGLDGGAPRPRTAWVPQDYRASLFPWFSVLKNVSMPRLVAGERDAEEVARRACARVVPRVATDARAGRLSGGEQQGVAIARALAWPSDVVFMDEPLSAIDASAKPGMRRAIEDELRGRALVLVTHDPADAAELCDRVLVLQAGRLVPA